MEKNEGFDKSDLKHLLSLIDNVIKYPENEWFAEKLAHIVGSYFRDTSFYNNSVLSNLSESVSKEVLIKQATAFYKNANLSPKTKSECIQDFILMEHARRNDDFEHFGLSVFQQIEGIMGEWFSKNSSLEKLRSIVDQPFLTRFDKTTSKYVKTGFPAGSNLIKKKVNSNFLSNEEILELVYDKKFNPIFSISIKDRLRIFSYISVFEETIFTQNIFNDFFEKLSSIYRVRNLAHRPKGDSFYKSDKTKVQETIDERHFEYFEFYNVLLKVVSSISKMEDQLPHGSNSAINLEVLKDLASNIKA